VAFTKNQQQRVVPKSQAEAALWALARDEFKFWCFLNGFKWSKHHQVLGEHLQLVAEGKINRLAVLMPRGSAKSTYASRLFPGFFLNKNPRQCILAASHTQELADKHGRAARNYVVTRGPCIGLDISPDSQAASRWSTVQGGEYFGVGVGGSVVGSRGDAACLDDLLAGVEDADSELVRDKVWEWLWFDLIPCLKPGARMILVNNRWHEDDVAGRLFDPRNEHYDAKEAAKWTVLRMPLLAEDSDPLLGRKPGELLWPEYYTWEMVETFKRDPRSWNAQYQQKPSSEEGDFFKKEWLKGYTPAELPKDLRIYFASDHAVSTKQVNDRTAVVVAGVCSQGYIWILPETLWGRYATDEVVEKVLDLIKLKKPLTWWAERGQITQSIGPFLRKRMRERCIYTSIEEVTPTKDKRTRAQAIHGRMSMGMVKFPKFAPWWPDAEHEILSFRGDGAVHDDFIDGMSLLGKGLDMLVGPAGAAQPKPEAPPRYTGAWLNDLARRQQFKQQMKLSTLGW
jgi:predicted phage terminase large subunit-like protein